MLFANAHIKCTVWHFVHHEFERRTTWHCRCNTHNFCILFCQFNDGMSKHILVFGRLYSIEFFLLNFTGYFIKQSWCMPFCLVFFCKLIAFTFCCNNV